MGLILNDYQRSHQIAQVMQKISRILNAGEDITIQGLASEEINFMSSIEALRMNDDVADMKIARQLASDPDDPELQRLFAQRVMFKWACAENQNDPFWGNYPPGNHIDSSQKYLVIGTMPNGEPCRIPVSRDTSNIGLLGSTGAGKTELLKRIMIQLVIHGRCVIATDKKRELRHLATRPELAGKVLPMSYQELLISLLQPPPIKGMRNRWLDEVTRLLSECYGRLAAQRLTRQILSDLFYQMPPEHYPTLSQIIASHEAFRPRFRGRESEYRESMLWVLKDLQNYSGGIFEYAQSDCLAQIFEKPRLIIIEADTLPPDHFQFLITYLMRWLYFWRLVDYEEA